MQYKSADEDLTLVSLEEFYDNAPEEVQDKEKTKGNEHLQRLARLQYENLQRREQFEECYKYLNNSGHSTGCKQHSI